MIGPGWTAVHDSGRGCFGRGIRQHLEPLCDTFEAARDLAARMQCYPKPFAVHENHRYRPCIREKVIDGCLGAPVSVYISQLDAREPTEAHKNEAGTGVFLEKTLACTFAAYRSAEANAPVALD
jgi:hypothetical protein